EVKVFGEDQAQIEAVAHKVAARIKSIAGLADLYDGIEGSSPMRLIRVDHEAAGRAHITAQDVLDRVGAGVLGASGGTMPWFDRRLPIRVRYPDELRFTPERVLAMPLVLPPGAGATSKVLPLGAVARFEDRPVPVELRREALRPVVVVTSDTEGRDLG